MDMLLNMMDYIENNMKGNIKMGKRKALGLNIMIMEIFIIKDFSEII